MSAANLFLIYGLNKRLKKKIWRNFLFSRKYVDDGSKCARQFSQKLNYFFENLRENRKSPVVFAKLFPKIKLFQSLRIKILHVSHFFAYLKTFQISPRTQILGEPAFAYFSTFYKEWNTLILF
jgi:hypothetical protein